MRLPRWLPNAISVLRIALVPLWLLLAFDARNAALAGAPRSAFWPIAVLLAIGASDLVDGVVARRFGLATNLGATLDAVADKLAQISTVAFLALAGAPAFVPLPLWLVIVLASRDALLVIGWVALRRRVGTVRAAHQWHGKASSALLFALVLAALGRAPAPVIDAGAWLVALLVVPSTIAYVFEGRRQLTRSRTS